MPTVGITMTQIFNRKNCQKETYGFYLKKTKNF